MRFIEQFSADRTVGRWLFSSDSCKHCNDAGCLNACPVQAIVRTDMGNVIVKQEVCIGCKYCIPSCPYGVISFSERTGTVHKCTLCNDRIHNGLGTACAKACPTGSITFGEVPDLKKKADARLVQLKGLGFEKANIYGYNEAGGLNVFYLFMDKPEVYGQPEKSGGTAGTSPRQLGPDGRHGHRGRRGGHRGVPRTWREGEGKGDQREIPVICMCHDTMRTSFKILIVILFFLWILPGTLGRDPWKADEPYSFGMVNNILRTEDWVVPAIAGVPFLEKPPLYYLTASFSSRVLSPFFEPPVAARLINLFWMSAALVALGLAARELAGERAAWTAPLYLMGCSLLQIPAHKLITDVALLAGFSLGFYGLAVSRRVPEWGGFWLGTGMGIGFLSKGLLAPGVFFLTVVVLPVLFSSWRTREYGRALAVAAVASVPWLVVWPALLYLRSPQYFIEWFWYQNLGRFLGFARIGKPDSHWYWVLNLPWLAWPVLPVAAWTLWKNRTNWRSRMLWQLPFTFFLILLAVLSVSASNRELYGLPLLLPLVLIASVESAAHSGHLAAFVRRVGIVLFGMLGTLLWFGWLLSIFGSQWVARYLPADTIHYQPVVPALFAGALLCTVAWLLSLPLIVRESAPCLASWSTGTVLVWGLVMTLGLPWLEAEASFRETFMTIPAAIPPDSRCVASYGMGESERAMAEYYSGIRTVPVEKLSWVPCDLLLIGRGNVIIEPASPEHWTTVWNSTRPKDHPKEYYTLYRHHSDRRNLAERISPAETFHLD